MSVQLWSLRDYTKQDFAAAVRDVARIGYQGVELAGYGSLTRDGAAQAVKDAGLVVSGMHVGVERVLGQTTEAIRDALAFGTRHVIVPFYPPELLRTPKACALFGEQLDAAGRQFHAHGLQLHYHNHGFELERLSGRTAFERILDAAAPKHLACQADVYWVKVGGEDPAAFLRRVGDRVKVVHLKDTEELGTGPVDFPSVFQALDGIGALEWQVVEVEKYNHAPIESVRLSFEKLRAWGRV